MPFLHSTSKTEKSLYFHRKLCVLHQCSAWEACEWDISLVDYLLMDLCKLVYLIWFADVYTLVPFRVQHRRTISTATPHIRSLHMEGKPCLHVLRYPQQMLAAQGSLSKATSGHGRQRCNIWLWRVLGSLLFVYQSSPCEHSGKSS